MTGNLTRSRYQGAPTPYSIGNGKIVTMIANTPIEMAVYKVGDSYYGARSNEFGYANYELLVHGPQNLVTLNRGEYDKEDQSEYLHVGESAE